VIVVRAPSKREIVSPGDSETTQRRGLRPTVYVPSRLLYLLRGAGSPPRSPAPDEHRQAPVKVPLLAEIKIITRVADPVMLGAFVHHCHRFGHSDNGILAMIAGTLSVAAPAGSADCAVWESDVMSDSPQRNGWEGPAVPSVLH